jgi:hypothetical protein
MSPAQGRGTLVRAKSLSAHVKDRAQLLEDHHKPRCPCQAAGFCLSNDLLLLQRAVLSPRLAVRGGALAPALDAIPIGHKPRRHVPMTTCLPGEIFAQPLRLCRLPANDLHNYLLKPVQFTPHSSNRPSHRSRVSSSSQGGSRSPNRNVASCPLGIHCNGSVGLAGVTLPSSALSRSGE